MNALKDSVFVCLVLVYLANLSTAALIDNGDGTITQIRTDGTQLMWLQDANQAATSGYPGYETVSEYCHTPNPATCFPISPQIGLAHAGALTWASTLDFAGHTDWRMASALNPDGSGPVIGSVGQGATGEMINLSFTEGIWRDAPGPFSNVQLSYWTGSSGPDVDDGIWDHLVLTSSQAILQSKQVVVGPDLFVLRRFAGWAVRDINIALDSADFDFDGDVDSADLSVWQTSFGIDAGADADGDGDSDGNDFLAWQSQFSGPGPAVAVATVPEPTSAGLFGVFFMIIVVFRHKCVQFSCQHC